MYTENPVSKVAKLRPVALAPGIGTGSLRVKQGQPRLARFLSLVFLVLICFALPQRAAAQTNETIINLIVSNGGEPVREDDRRLIFRADLTERFDEDITVDWAVTGGTASAADFSGYAGSGTVTIEADTGGEGIRFTPFDDVIVEDPETLILTISPNNDAPLPAGVTIGTATATGTLTDNDEAPGTTASISIADAEVVDEENGIARFTITLEPRALTSDALLDVAYAPGPDILGTQPAMPEDDLGSNRSTTVRIPAGSRSVVLEVPIADDDEDEGREVFTVTISSNSMQPDDPETGLPPQFILLFPRAEAIGTIRSHEEPLTTNISIADADPVAENGIARFTISLEPLALTSDVVLDVAYTGTGTRPAIPEDDLGSDRPTIVTIPADTRSVVLEVPITGDDEDEGEETFTVGLSVAAEQPDDPETGRPPNFVLLFPRAEATGTITDNDRAPTGDDTTVRIEDVTVGEAEGPARFTVSLSEAVNSAVVLAVTYQAGDTNPATLADDLGTLPTMVTIEDGDTSATLTLPIINDAIVEGDETFTVILSEDGANPLPTGVSIADGEATGMITDDDTARVALSPPTLSAIEGELFTYTVSLSAPASRAVTITWIASREAGDTATLVDDLQAPRTGTLTFAANNAGDKTFTIQPVIDGGDEGDEGNEEDETFTVTLTATDTLPTGVVIDTQNNRSVATIINNRPATVSIADADPVAEDAGPARFTVSLSEAVSSDVVLDVSYAARTAVLGDLGSPRPATVTLPANSLEATLEVPIFDDAIVEGAETFAVTVSESRITPLPAGVSIADGEATGTIALTAETSVLIESRRTGAGTALRRHVSRFDSMTGSVVQSRLDGRETQRVSSSDNLGSGHMAVGGGLGNTGDTDDTGETPWGAWLNGAWTGFGGTTSGRQADVYGGMDYLGEGWLIGGLLGYEVADLDIGEATYSANYTHVGVYGGARLAGRLLFDGAATYGMATPNVALGDISASYKARRITARGALTGDFGLEYGLKNGSLTIAPQLGLLYARERLGGFTDSAGGVAEREVLELGRFSAGPRLIWDFEGGQLVGGLRMQGDFLQLDDGAEGRISGAVNIGLRLDLTPNATLGIQGDVDGLGITDEFRSYGGNIELDIRF